MTYYKFLFIVPRDLAKEIENAAWALRMCKAEFVRECIRCHLKDIKQNNWRGAQVVG